MWSLSPFAGSPGVRSGSLYGDRQPASPSTARTRNLPKLAREGGFLRWSARSAFRCLQSDHEGGADLAPDFAAPCGITSGWLRKMAMQVLVSSRYRGTADGLSRAAAAGVSRLDRAGRTWDHQCESPRKSFPASSRA